MAVSFGRGRGAGQFRPIHQWAGRAWLALGLAVTVTVGAVGLAAPAQAVSACTPSSVFDGTATVLTFPTGVACNWTVPTGVTSVDLLAVGGGGGGTGLLGSPAGGGAGGMIYRTGVAVTAGATQSITVGAGGAANVLGGNGSTGSNSVALGSTAIGGGGGGNGQAGLAGGSGGGGGYGLVVLTLTAFAGGSGTAGQGSNGGAAAVPAVGGGGGGGAGGVGGIGGNSTALGLPGAGSSNSITGTAATYAVGGASMGTYAYPTLAAGADNPSIGGGGRASGLGASAGNNGTVIIRFTTPPTLPIFSAAAAPATGTTGTAYSYTFAASGPPAPTFTLNTGTLPTGLALSSAGVLSGTPTATGSFTFTVNATNSVGVVSSVSQTIVISAVPVFTASSPPLNATAGSAYSGYTFTASGTPAPTFAVGTGSLPFGMSLSPAGVLSGTPSFSGNSTFTVTANNSAGTATSSSITITSGVAPSFLVVAPPTTGTVGTAYAGYTFSTLTGIPAPTFSVLSGTLPTGLALSSAGVLSGTPTVAGSYSFVVRASNFSGVADTSSQTIVISPANSMPAFVNQSAPTTATVGTAYAGYTFTATGYPAPLFTVTGGTSLPLGLGLNPVTGALSGTPLASGTSTFTVSATNSSGTVVSNSISIVVAPLPVVPIFVSASPPDSAVNTAYTPYTFTTLGVPAPTFSVTAGSLPTGLTLSSGGVLSGTPTVAGQSTFTVQATNSAGTQSAGNITIKITSTPAFVNQSPPTLASWMTPYAGYTFTATGYPAPVFSVNGLLPLGMALNPTTGVLSGTPILTGDSTFTVSATNPSTLATVTTNSITLTVGLAPSFLTSSPSTTGQVGQVYSSYTFTALGFPTPTFTVASGNLPAGLSLSTGGVLSGTPTVAGPSTFTVRATNTSGTVDTSSITIAVNPVNSAPAFLHQTPPTTGTVGTAYAGYTFTASGFPAPVFGALGLPLGLVLDPFTGVLSGTPLASGSSTFTVSATSLSGTVNSASITITVDPLPISPVFVLASPPSTATVGTAYPSYSFTAIGVPTPTFSVASGTLPTGLSLSSAGVLSGTPSAAGTFTFAVSVSNSAGSATSSTRTITVAPTPVLPVFTASSAPSSATVLSAYSGYTFTASGVPAPTFAVATGALPLGMTLSSAGVLSGTPILTGTSTFTVSATNTAGSVNSSSQSITVDPIAVAPFFLSALPPSTGTVGTTYAGYTFTAFGTPAPTFAVATGALPGGLTLSSAGVLGGTPTAAGTFTFIVSATNSAGTASTLTETIIVAPLPVAPVFTAAGPPLSGTVLTAYAGYTFAASGVPAPTYTVASGSLPFGLILDPISGALSGTPLLDGASTFTVRASNAAGQVDTSSLTITVAPVPVPPIFGTTLLLPTTGTVGTAYPGYTFTALGVPAPTFSVGSGSLPTGLSLSASGALTGTPTAAGAFTFVIAAGSSAGTSSSGSLTITVAPQPVAPVFTASTPPGGTVLSAYSGYTFAASGVPAPTYSVTSGLLPLGLVLNSSTGALSGLPVVAGTSTFTVTATNSAGAVSTPSRSITITPAALIPLFVNQLPPLTGTAGTAYAGYTYTALGYPAPAFSVFAGSLPTGMSLSTGGVLSGTPTTAGTYTFTVQASNASGTVYALPTVIVVSPAAAAPVLVDQSPPGTGTVGTPYTYTFTGTGYPAPTFAVASGSLPAGLTLIGGLLAGIPLSAGTSTFTISATNASGAVSSGSKTIVISPLSVAPVFTSLAPLPATVGMPYTHSFVALGYPLPTYSVTSGSLPTGMTLSSSGVLSGTPAPGTDTTYSFDVTATNGTAPDDTQSVSFTVLPAPTLPVAPLFIGFDPADATVGAAYSHTFTAIGFPAPTFSTTDPLPAGLTLSSAGVLSGTPTTGADGSYTFGVTASNATNVTKMFTLTVNPAPSAPVLGGITADSTTVLSFYTHTFVATGVPSTMLYTTTDPLPLGVILLPNGVLTGIPLVGTSKAYPVTIKASNGVAPDATMLFTLTVNPAPAAPVFTDLPPLPATVGTAYSHTFTALGVPSAMTFSTSDPLPTGVTLSSGGVLAGTPGPGSQGTYSIDVTASNGTVPDTTRTISLVVLPAPAAPAIADPGALTATAGSVYSQQLTATGYPAPIFTTLDALPVGLTLSPTGELAGIPLGVGVGPHSFTVTATNGVNPSDSRVISLTVTPAPVAPILTAFTPPTGVVGVAYPGYTFTALGYPAPTFTADANLPAGLALSSSGVLSGTPTVAGDQPFLLTASNGVGSDATFTVHVVVGTLPVFTTASPTLSATALQPYSYTFAASGSPSPVYGTLSQLPAGWGLNPVTGELSALLPTAGSFTFSVTATSLSGTTTAGPFTITVAPASLAPTLIDPALQSSTASVGLPYLPYLFLATGFPVPTFSTGAGIPPGLSVSSLGLLSGTPTTAGDYTFTLTASNGTSPDATRSIHIVVGQAPAFTASSPPLTATAGTAYAGYTFAASGSPAPVFATLTQLPLGWSLDPTTGALSAASPAAGMFTFSVTATSSAGIAVAGPFTVTVGQAPLIPAFVADSPPATGTVLSLYGPYQFTATGFPLPTFSATGLPAGLLLDPLTGVLTGLPLFAGTSSVVVTAHNSVGDAATSTITIVIDALPVPPLFVSALPPIVGVIGTAYPSYTFVATGSPTPTFTVSSGALPTGLSLDPTTGVLSGTPTAAGTFTFRVHAASSAGSVTTGLLTVLVTPTATVPSFTAATPPNTGSVATLYGPYSFAASGSPAPVYARASGNLPPGLLLDPLTGELTGLPLIAGSYTFTVSATNSAGTDTSSPITVTVALHAPAAPDFAALTIPSTGQIGTPFPSYTFLTSGFPDPTFAVASGSLPAGLSLDPNTGVLSGTPTAAGTSTFRIAATNATSTVTTGAITITVTAPNSGPEAPTGVSATAGVASLTVSWTAVPGATSYTASDDPGSASCTTTGTSCVMGATAGTATRATVTATTPAGTSAPSSPSNAVTPTAPVVPPSVPTTGTDTLTTDKGQIGLTSPGATVTVMGEGFAPFSTATVIVYSSPITLGSITTDKDGAFSKEVTVPQLEAGKHTFVASGVDEAGKTRATRLPITVAHTSITGANGTLPIPAGGKVTLLDPDGATASTVTVDQGKYSLDPSTGLIKFTAIGGFTGTADAVHYRVSDALGTVVNGTYAAVVSTPAGKPLLPLPDRLVTSRGGTATVPCGLSTGTLVKCTIVATVDGSVVGRGTATATAARGLSKLSVAIPLSAKARGLIARPGGARISFAAVLTQVGHSTTTTLKRSTIVLAKSFNLPRSIRFSERSREINLADVAYLKTIRGKLTGASTISCVGHAESMGGDAFTLALALARAKNVCALLVASGLSAEVRTSGVVHQEPTGKNDTEANRARNRRVDVTIIN
jgi:CshA-type fibril repeat protein